MASRTAEYYKKNPEARKKRLKQQAKYNKTGKGLALRVNANRLRDQLNIPVGDKRDAAHYNGSTTKGRPQSRSKNRSRK